MRQFLVILAVAVSCSVTTSLLMAQRGQATGESAGRGTASPPPLGRTLDDVRKQYTQTKIQAAGAGALAVPPPRIVDAEVFALTDSNGNVRAELGADDAGTKMQMFDTHGKPRLVLLEGEGSTKITLFDADGTPGVEIRLTGIGDTTVAIGRPQKDTAPLTFHVEPAGDAKVSLQGVKGEEALSLSAHRDFGGIVELYGAGKTGIFQSGALSLTTPQGGPRAELTLHKDSAQLDMSPGGTLKTNVQLGSGGETSWLTLNSTDFGRVDLRAADFGSLLTLKPHGGAGGLDAMTRLENGKTATHLWLSNIDGLQKLQLNVNGEGKASARLIDDTGRATFSAP